MGWCGAVRGGTKSEIFLVQILDRYLSLRQLNEGTSTEDRSDNPITAPHFLDTGVLAFFPPVAEQSERYGTMSMNLFRLAGDMSHVFSIIVLLLRLRVVKNASGKLGHHTIRAPPALCGQLPMLG